MPFGVSEGRAIRNPQDQLVLACYFLMDGGRPGEAKPRNLLKYTTATVLFRMAGMPCEGYALIESKEIRLCERVHQAYFLCIL